MRIQHAFLKSCIFNVRVCRFCLSVSILCKHAALCASLEMNNEQQSATAQYHFQSSIHVSSVHQPSMHPSIHRPVHVSIQRSINSSLHGYLHPCSPPITLWPQPSVSCYHTPVTHKSPSAHLVFRPSPWLPSLQSLCCSLPLLFTIVQFMSADGWFLTPTSLRPLR